MGWLAAWLLKGEAAGADWCYKAEHCAIAISPADRAEGRRRLHMLPGAQELFDLERPRRAGEPEEPERQP